MLQHAPPFKVLPQNWFPLLLYKKVLSFTPIESIRYGNVSMLKNTITFTDIKDAVEIYCNPVDDIEYILDAMILINNIYENNYIGELIQSAKNVASKNK